MTAVAAQTSLVMWFPIPIEDPRGAALAGRHYSRQTVGAKGFVPPGRRMAFLFADATGAAVWAACLNLDPRGTLRWRNTIFRNESGTRSSSLITAATLATYERWQRRYGALPSIGLTTEIDIEATSARRSKRHEPGYCYRRAGWVEIRRAPPPTWPTGDGCARGAA